MDKYEARANGAVNFLCQARSDEGLRTRMDLLFCSYAALAEERMPLFAGQDERCGFYVRALDMVSDALFWAERKNVVEAKARLARFYEFLDEVVDANLVPRPSRQSFIAHGLSSQYG